MRAGLVSARCLLRGLPLLCCRTPRTPLRVLCLVALDTLHVLRHLRPLPRQRINELAMLLDFQACTNAAWDRKDLRGLNDGAIRQRLENAGLGTCIEAYLNRLRGLEACRPPIGGDRRRFDEVRSYREAVARLSLATVAAAALYGERLEESIGATRCDSDLETLFRLAMQCQIIDDVVDYGADLTAGLPGFLTACASLPLAMELTAEAARSYGAGGEQLPHGAVFPLRLAMRVVTAVAKAVVALSPSWALTSCFRRGMLTPQDGGPP